ncbi:hypothetical protein F3Y22_tig00110429pilonHSYRG00266 [Hibiscus syriacus]|uniref:Uncharacterized protein n=1 Tax=Hibiscus syriacus TaxID=106335 RepID=A0A6A3AKU5_HIBSY|nr:hypothetical protein F3Y22_tig00110429pilonHSYRG00266 [Hibiscus syriacus]
MRFPRLIQATPNEYEPMEKYFREQAESYWHFVKHIEGVTGTLMVVLMAIAFTLAMHWFRRGRMSLPKPLNKLSALMLSGILTIYLSLFTLSSLSMESSSS